MAHVDVAALRRITVVTRYEVGSTFCIQYSQMEYTPLDGMVNVSPLVVLRVRTTPLSSLVNVGDAPHVMYAARDDPPTAPPLPTDACVAAYDTSRRVNMYPAG